MRRSTAIGCAVFAAVLAWSAQAQTPAPPPARGVVPERPLEAPPPPVEAPAEPQVHIPVQDGDKVEEYREGGRVVMLRVTPRDGPPYYLVDTSGQGNWVRRDSLDDGVRVPMWTIKTWD